MRRPDVVYHLAVARAGRAVPAAQAGARRNAVAMLDAGAARSGVEGRRRRCRRARCTATCRCATCRSRRVTLEPAWGCTGSIARGRRRPAQPVSRRARRVEFTALALAHRLRAAAATRRRSRRQRSPHAAAAATPPSDPRRRASDPRLPVHRRRRRRAGRAGDAWRRTGRQHRHRRSDVDPRPVDDDRRPGGARAGHAPRRAADDSRGSRCRRRGPASTWRGRRGPTVAGGLRSAGLNVASAGSDERSVASSAIAISGVVMTDGVTTQRMPAASTSRRRGERRRDRSPTLRRSARTAVRRRRRIGSMTELAIMRSAGPFSAAPPTIGDTATTDPRRCGEHRVDAASARIGPIDTIGFDGRDHDAVGRRRAPSADPGAARPRRAIEAAPTSTGTPWRQSTKYSWNETSPPSSQRHHGGDRVVGHRHESLPRRPRRGAISAVTVGQCGAFGQPRGSVEVRAPDPGRRG